MSLFSDSGVGLVLSMVRYSPDIKQVIIARLMMWVLYNERTNCVRARVQALVNKSLIW